MQDRNSALSELLHSDTCGAVRARGAAAVSKVRHSVAERLAHADAEHEADLTAIAAVKAEEVKRVAVRARAVEASQQERQASILARASAKYTAQR